jgi:hypothetical protein
LSSSLSGKFTFIFVESLPDLITAGSIFSIKFVVQIKITLSSFSNPESSVKNEFTIFVSSQ